MKQCSPNEQSWRSAYPARPRAQIFFNLLRNTYFLPIGMADDTCASLDFKSLAGTVYEYLFAAFRQKILFTKLLVECYADRILEMEHIFNRFFCFTDRLYLIMPCEFGRNEFTDSSVIKILGRAWLKYGKWRIT